MTSINLFALTLLPVILFAEIWSVSPALSLPSQSVIAQAGRQSRRTLFKPPANQKAPKSTLGGGRRNENRCPVVGAPATTTNPSKPIPLMALLPTGNLGTTLVSHPSILVYVPATSARTAELTLEDDQGDGLYQTQITLPGTPGVISFELPRTEAGLKVGKDYKWVLTLVCNPSGPQDPYVEGWIRRIEADSRVTRQLSSAKDLEQVTLYASSGIWHEALGTLAGLRRSQPTNAALVTAWQELLQSAGLEAIATAPLQK